MKIITTPTVLIFLDSCETNNFYIVHCRAAQQGGMGWGATIPHEGAAPLKPVSPIQKKLSPPPWETPILAPCKNFKTLKKIGVSIS